MSEQFGTEAAQPQNVPSAMDAPMVDENQTEVSTEERVFGPDDVKRIYFANDKIQTDALPYIAKIEELQGLDKFSNFKPEDEFPANYGIMVIPMMVRSSVKGEKQKLTGVAICGMPDPSLVAQDEKGQKFIREAVISAFATKLANSFRPRSDGSVAATAPFTVEDFLTSKKGGESLKAFTTMAPHFVKALRKKGLNFLSVQLLRQILQSSQFAAQVVAAFDQAKWEGILDIMIVKSDELGLDSAIFKTWKETRNEVTVGSIQEDDLSDLEEMEIEIA